MADNFFGFGTDMPTLGVGKMNGKNMGTELLEALEDDEIDMLNDETFGAGADEGNWEEEHEKLAGEFESFHGRSESTNGHHGSDMLLEPSLHPDPKYNMQEVDLEHSLSQLVVDDEDELEDPAIMNASKNRPIPMKSHVNLDELFGPSSPPGFLNTENLSKDPVSPEMNNIWQPNIHDTLNSSTPRKPIPQRVVVMNHHHHQMAPLAPPQHFHHPDFSGDHMYNNLPQVSPGRTNIWGSPAQDSYMPKQTPPQGEGPVYVQSRPMMQQGDVRHMGDGPHFMGRPPQPGTVMQHHMAQGTHNIPQGMKAPGVMEVPKPPTQGQGDGGIQNLLHMLQQPKGSSSQHDPSLVVAGQSLASQLPNAHAAGDLEQRMMHPPPGGSNHTPRVISAEDLERQMRGESVPIPPRQHKAPSPTQQGLPLPIGTPPRGHYMQQVPQVPPPHQGSPHQTMFPRGVPPPGTPGVLHRASPPSNINPHSTSQGVPALMSRLVRESTESVAHSPSFSSSQSVGLSRTISCPAPSNYMHMQHHAQAAPSLKSPVPVLPRGTIFNVTKQPINSPAVTPLQQGLTAPIVCAPSPHLRRTPTPPMVSAPSPVYSLNSRRGSSPCPVVDTISRLQGSRATPAFMRSFSVPAPDYGYLHPPSPVSSNSISIPGHSFHYSVAPITMSPSTPMSASVPGQGFHYPVVPHTPPACTAASDARHHPALQSVSSSFLPSHLVSPIAQRILRANSILSNSPGSGRGPAVNQNKPMPPFLANTPVQQRMPYHSGMSDPGHGGRGYRGHPPHPAQIRQSLFNQNRNNKGTHYHQQRYQDQQERFHQERHYNRGNLAYQDQDRNRGPRYHDNQGHYPNRYQERWQDQNQRYHRGGRGGRGGHYGNRQYHDDRYEEYEEEEDRSGDPFANLMTQREKDWIIKIQLWQLHTENPYLDDFYYTTLTMRKMAAERQKKQEGIQRNKKADIEPQLLLPQLAKVENRSYKPIQFEGSLGRLTASSVHNPRQIIDVGVSKAQEGEDSKTKASRRFKQLLVDLEISYDLLLDIDDVEKKALALPENQRPFKFQERRDKIRLLYDRLQCHSNNSEHFLRIASVRKGVKLIARTLPLLENMESTLLTTGILQVLPAFMKKPQEGQALLESLNGAIRRSGLERLVHFSDALRRGASDNNLSKDLVIVLQNKFGASVVFALLNQGEVVYSTVSPVDMEIEHQNAWLQFVQWVCEAVMSMSCDQMVAPSLAHHQVMQHIQRLVDKKTLVKVEDQLSTILSARDSAVKS